MVPGYPSGREKPLAPRGVLRRPAELALGLLVRGAADLGHHRHAGLAAGDPAQPGRDVAGRLGAGRLGQRGQPLADGRGLVVDDVVDAWLAALDGERGRLGGIVDVDEGPDAVT